MYLLCLGPNKLIINENAAWAQSFNTQVYLARRSLMQLPKGFREGQDLAAQTEGTFPMSMLWNTSSRSADMTTSPLMAFWRLIRDARTTEVRRLNRISSCLNTVFMDSLYNTGYFFITCSLQKNILKQNVCQPSELLYIKCITFIKQQQWQKKCVRTNSKLQSFGNFPRISAARSWMTSAVDLPPLLAWRGRVNKMLSNN